MNLLLALSSLLVLQIARVGATQIVKVRIKVRSGRDDLRGNSLAQAFIYFKGGYDTKAEAVKFKGIGNYKHQEKEITITDYGIQHVEDIIGVQVDLLHWKGHWPQSDDEWYLDEVRVTAVTANGDSQVIRTARPSLELTKHNTKYRYIWNQGCMEPKHKTCKDCANNGCSSCYPGEYRRLDPNGLFRCYSKAGSGALCYGLNEACISSDCRHSSASPPDASRCCQRNVDSFCDLCGTDGLCSRCRKDYYITSNKLCEKQSNNGRQCAEPEQCKSNHCTAQGFCCVKGFSVPNCKQCGEGNFCTECEDSHYENDGQCRRQKGNSIECFEDKECISGNCFERGLCCVQGFDDSNCKRCGETNLCKLCHENYYVHNGKCTLKKPNGDECTEDIQCTSRNCWKQEFCCSDIFDVKSCERCGEGNNCNTCEVGYYLEAGKCHQMKPNGHECSSHRECVSKYCSNEKYCCTRGVDYRFCKICGDMDTCKECINNDYFVDAETKKCAYWGPIVFGTEVGQVLKQNDFSLAHALALYKANIQTKGQATRISDERLEELIGGAVANFRELFPKPQDPLSTPEIVGIVVGCIGLVTTVVATVVAVKTGCFKDTKLCQQLCKRCGKQKDVEIKKTGSGGSQSKTDGGDEDGAKPDSEGSQSTSNDDAVENT